jgi:hypothetical protein
MVTFPSTVGGGNWNGLSFDPALGLAFTNVMNIGQFAKMVQGTSARRRTAGPGYAAARGRDRSAASGIRRRRFRARRPPFGELVAVDVSRGEVAWKVPLGMVESLKARGFDKTGTLNIGGSIATAGGVFSSARRSTAASAPSIEDRRAAVGDRARRLRPLVPMTFLGKDGRQYVVVAAGGGSFLGAPPARRSSRSRCRGRHAPALTCDRRRWLGAAAIAACRGAASRPARKHVLAWADVRTAISTTRSRTRVATIERLGRESGAYDTFIRTDSQLITKRRSLSAGTGIATGEQFNVRNLNYFDAIFFFGVREIELTPSSAPICSRSSRRREGFVAAHSAATAFFSWPEFGEMLGGRFDEHPWGITDGTVVVDDPKFPAMRHCRRASLFATSSTRSRISRATRFMSSRTLTHRGWI